MFGRKKTADQMIEQSIFELHAKRGLHLENIKTLNATIQKCITLRDENQSECDKLEIAIRALDDRYMQPQSILTNEELEESLFDFEPNEGREPVSVTDFTGRGLAAVAIIK